MANASKINKIRGEKTWILHSHKIKVSAIPIRTIQRYFEIHFGVNFFSIREMPIEY